MTMETNLKYNILKYNIILNVNSHYIINLTHHEIGT